MRITTQMLNESAKKLGLPIHRQTLLDHLKSNDSSDSLFSAVQQPTAAAAYNAVSRTKYEKTEKSANELFMQAQKFMDDGEGSLFAKAEKTGDTSELCKEVEKLADKYNGVLKNMKNATNPLDKLYCQSLKEIAEDNEDRLKAVGISIDKDGSMSVNRDKLKSASLEDLKKALGEDSSFSSGLTFLSYRIADNAGANAGSLSNNYLSNGNIAAEYLNRYDFKG